MTEIFNILIFNDLINSVDNAICIINGTFQGTYCAL